MQTPPTTPSPARRPSPRSRTKNAPQPHKAVTHSEVLSTEDVKAEWLAIWRDEALPMPIRKACLDNLAKELGMLKDRKVNEFPALDTLLKEMGVTAGNRIAGGRKPLKLAGG